MGCSGCGGIAEFAAHLHGGLCCRGEASCERRVSQGFGNDEHIFLFEK